MTTAQEAAEEHIKEYASHPGDPAALVVALADARKHSYNGFLAGAAWQLKHFEESGDLYVHGLSISQIETCKMFYLAERGRLPEE